jgi:hypothetical protein
MKSLLRLAMFGTLSISPLAALAEPDRSHIRHLSIDALKAIYLACNDGVMNGRLATGSVAACSVVYEELKERGFGGDFDRFLAWSRSQPSAKQPVETPAGDPLIGL